MNATMAAEDPPTDEGRQAVRAGLIAHKRKMHPDNDFAPVQVVARDEVGSVRGGAPGSVQWGELYVDMFWVADKMRGQGMGTCLMQSVEEEAQWRGCHRVHPGAMTFQAPHCYPKIGYIEYARFGGNPNQPERFM